MAGVIGVADALAGTGFTRWLAMPLQVCSVLASHRLYFCRLCFAYQYLRHLHGFEYGAVYIFAPIAIAACTSLGLNPPLPRLRW